MQKLINLAILIFFSLQINAATSITSPTVLGHWTLAGSPYRIYNNIKVDSSQSLTIDPGVEVIFHGNYRFEIYGSLHAAGTSSQIITFTINDTTGWATDTVFATGGWHGIQFYKYAGSAADNSILQYCDISFTKFTDTEYYAASSNLLSTIHIDRPLSVKNCNFFNNRQGKFRPLFELFTYYPGVAFTFDACTFHDNKSNNILMELWNNDGHIAMRNSKVYRNTANFIMLCENVKLDLDDNEIYENTSRENTIYLYSYAAARTIADIKRNKIHHNTMVTGAAIMCLPGKINIEGNLICNNAHTINTSCPWVEGGGGIRCIYNDTSVPTTFVIKNNIIANNSSTENGGGINISGGNAIIANNHIVNNTSPQGAGIFFFDEGSVGAPTIIRNNLFYGNTCTAPYTGNIGGYISHSVEYTNNWTQYPFFIDVSAMLALAVSPTDSITNLIGTSPGMVAPTSIAGITDNALTANFSLSSTSSCINAGDTVGVSYTLYDYALNYRFAGSHIDVGAYEYGAGAFPMGITPPLVLAESLMSVYPNPATNRLYISTNEASGTVILVDMTGKVVLEQKVTTTTIPFDLTALPRCMYMVIWEHSSGRNVQKVILE